MDFFEGKQRYERQLKWVVEVVHVADSVVDALDEMLVRVLQRKDIGMVLSLLDVEVRGRLVLQFFVVNDFDVRVRFFYLRH